MIIGLTGGIGSGKSTVADYFRQQGITVINADQVARDVVAIGEPALTTIAARFGADILQHDGQLDRSQLRRIIFAEPSEKQWLEALLHPLINQRIRQQLQQAQSIYTVLESPLLLEGQQKTWVDRILVVDVPKSLQIERALKRDGTDRKTLEAIIEAQMQRDKRLGYADDVIDNSRDLATLKQQWQALHQTYQQRANGQTP